MACRKGGRRTVVTQGHVRRWSSAHAFAVRRGSEADPYAVAPVAPAGMFPPSIVVARAPPPVVGVYDHSEFLAIGVGAANVPAGPLGVADDGGRGSGDPH